ncbi:hypothetical protein Ahy_B01g056698 [Arachis hypogaea]|uniref:Uncharacterized protein n=1 Tax=Arachis hypogaea TaxID=3818 RepID=A0A445AZC9_ARAHY|nr:hypothetical protein Ahy_B01g056698 [Arachis hypogaea]
MTAAAARGSERRYLLHVMNVTTPSKDFLELVRELLELLIKARNMLKTAPPSLLFVAKSLDDDEWYARKIAEELKKSYVKLKNVRVERGSKRL